ncbi:hypothetical protein Misp01_24390 [Microtetraspora sp. NBRC 13810]|uniref:SurA N-terminal domain-containing protein n=1 Tax=Microtetraspora sp. NBRC 13810 TaxID=3030990 RepID=UPI0024A0380C|nr:SurA N-terminal domain-containing protein [Microtetraspora sp. NBRC 13810]GLW07309.1 hypothetical protein Misp01_24390 [Microtetraspora sp. NBRC 13810]
MKTPKRLALALMVAGFALTACSSAQPGTAAIVGSDRITASRLDADVREAQAALAKDPSAQQQQSSLSLPQMALLQLVEVSRYDQLARKDGVAVTNGEVDGFISAQGGLPQVQRTLLGQGVAPSMTRDYIRAFLTAQKLLAKHGGGTDEAALQRGQEQLVKDLQAIPVSYSPRYGKFDPQTGVFIDSDRFGKTAGPAGGAAGDPAAPPIQ